MTDLHNEVKARLVRDDQRYTRGRRRLVDLLAAAQRPLTMNDVLDLDGSLAQSSVYRNLAVLESGGVVHRIHSGDGHAHFELAENLTDDHHHHLVCRGCGSVFDFETTGAFEKSVTRLLGEVESQTGFRAEAHRFDLIGTCEDCR
jgi:Fe2+ or Zn2+ uptake regulation protein